MNGSNESQLISVYLITYVKLPPICSDVHLFISIYAFGAYQMSCHYQYVICNVSLHRQFHRLFLPSSCRALQYHISTLATNLRERQAFNLVSNNWSIDVYRKKSLQMQNLSNATWRCHCNGFECGSVRFHFLVCATCKRPPTAAAFFFRVGRTIGECLPCMTCPFLISASCLLPFLSRRHGTQRGRLLQLLLSLHFPRRYVGRGTAAHR